jgi:D-3-phosphoglycerate dehydrogenase
MRAGAKPMSASELREIIAPYEGAILGLDSCDASVLERADKLRVISRYGSGVDQVDLETAARRGIAVTNTPGANRIAVAELTIGLLFALARNLPQTVSAARAGRWNRSAGIELCGKTLGIIGLGMVGQEVASRALVMGMTVLGCDPLRAAPVPGVEQVDLSELLRRSDIVSLHCIATPETHNLINNQTLSQMRDASYLINTARGVLVNETDLLWALTTRKLAGAAADALCSDPPTDSPLLALDNFLYTPHIGATTRESVGRMSQMAAENLVAVLNGRPCDNIVNSPQLRARL